MAPPTGLPRLDELTLYPADRDYIEKIAKQIKAKFADIFCGHILVSLVSAACSNERCFFGGRGLDVGLFRCAVRLCRASN